MNVTKDDVGKWCAVDIKDTIVAALILEEPQIKPDHYKALSMYCKVFIPDFNLYREVAYMSQILLIGDELTIPEDMDVLLRKAGKKQTEDVEHVKNSHSYLISYLIEDGKMTRLI